MKPLYNKYKDLCYDQGERYRQGIRHTMRKLKCSRFGNLNHNSDAELDVYKVYKFDGVFSEMLLIIHLPTERESCDLVHSYYTLTPPGNVYVC